MLLKSYSFSPAEISPKFYYEVYTELQKYKWYFYKFAGAKAEEAMNKSMMHIFTHFNKEKGSLADYIKKLARVISKDNGKIIFIDFIEQTLSEDTDDEDLQPSVTTRRVKDFTEDLFNEIDNNNNKRKQIACLALEFMDKFVTLCNALIIKDSSTVYYPEPFMKSCLKINDNCTNFNEQCINLYREFEEDFGWFLSLDDNNEGTLKEADYLVISNSSSKRFKLINDVTGVEVKDADSEPFHLVGNLGTGYNRKRLIKVPYEDIWEYMCDKIDSFETNEMKFIIDDNYIIRTYGGSITTLNTDLYNCYDLIRDEILTNIILDTRGKVVNVGSSAIYLICSPDFDTNNSRVIKDFPIDFEYIDITESV